MSSRDPFAGIPFEPVEESGDASATGVALDPFAETPFDPVPEENVESPEGAASPGFRRARATEGRPSEEAPIQQELAAAGIPTGLPGGLPLKFKIDAATITPGGRALDALGSAEVLKIDPGIAVRDSEGVQRLLRLQAASRGELRDSRVLQWALEDPIAGAAVLENLKEWVDLERVMKDEIVPVPELELLRFGQRATRQGELVDRRMIGNLTDAEIAEWERLQTEPRPEPTRPPLTEQTIPPWMTLPQAEALSKMSDELLQPGTPLPREPGVADVLQEAKGLARGFTQSAAENLPNWAYIATHGGGGYMAGASIAALGTYATTRSRAAAARAWKIGGKIGGQAGALEASYHLNAGESLASFETLRDEQGQPLPREAVVGAAVLSGLVKAGIDFASMRAVFQLVPGGKAIFTGPLAASRERLKEALKDRKTLAALAAFGHSYITAISSEGAAEGLQTVVDQAGRGALKGYAAGEDFLGTLEYVGKEVVEGIPETAHAAKEAMKATALYGIAGGLGTITQNAGANLIDRIGRGKAEAERIAAMGAITKALDEHRTKARGSFRGIVQRMADEHGISAVYMEPAEVHELFQQKKIRLEVLSPEAVAELLAAAREGRRAAIPAGDFFATVEPLMAAPEEGAEEAPGAAEARQRATLTPDAIPPSEAEPRMTSFRAELELMAKVALGAPETEVSPVAESYFQRLRQTLVEAGPHTPEQAGILGALMKHQVITGAARRGIPVEQYLRLHGLRIMGERAPIAPARPEFGEAPIRDVRRETRQAELEGMIEEYRRGVAPLPPRRKYPVLNVLRRAGGVDPRSTLAGELRNLGVTHRTMPGLFRREGAGAADTVIWNEWPELSSLEHPGGLGDYIPEAAILEAIRQELAGRPTRPVAEVELEGEMMLAREEMERALEEAGVDLAGMTDEQAARAVLEAEARAIDELFQGAAEVVAEGGALYAGLPVAAEGADVTAEVYDVVQEGTTPAGAAASARSVAEHLAAAGRVGFRKVGYVRTGVTRIRRAEDVAHLLASFRKDPQENAAVVITGPGGKLLRVVRTGRGTRTANLVHPLEVLSPAFETPGAARIWFVHNHPSGEPSTSPEDRAIADRLRTVLRGSGIELAGGIVVAGTRATVFSGPTTDAAAYPERSFTIPPALRKSTVAVFERRFLRTPRARGAPAVTGPEDLRDFVLSAESPGVLFLDGRHRAMAWLPMELEEFQTLRSGGAQSAVARLIREGGRVNAVAMIAVVPEAMTPDLRSRLLGNLSGFGDAVGVPVLDLLYRTDGTRVRSVRDESGINPSRTFFQPKRPPPPNPDQGDLFGELPPGQRESARVMLEREARERGEADPFTVAALQAALGGGDFVTLRATPEELAALTNRPPAVWRLESAPVPRSYKIGTGWYAVPAGSPVATIAGPDGQLRFVPLSRLMPAERPADWPADLPIDELWDEPSPPPLTDEEIARAESTIEYEEGPRPPEIPAPPRPPTPPHLEIGRFVELPTGVIVRVSGPIYGTGPSGRGQLRVQYADGHETAVFARALTPAEPPGGWPRVLPGPRGRGWEVRPAGMSDAAWVAWVAQHDRAWARASAEDLGFYDEEEALARIQLERGVETFSLDDYPGGVEALPGPAEGAAARELGFPIPEEPEPTRHEELDAAIASLEADLDFERTGRPAPSADAIAEIEAEIAELQDELAALGPRVRTPEEEAEQAAAIKGRADEYLAGTTHGEVLRWLAAIRMPAPWTGAWLFGRRRFPESILASSLKTLDEIGYVTRVVPESRPGTQSGRFEQTVTITDQGREAAKILPPPGPAKRRRARGFLGSPAGKLLQEILRWPEGQVIEFFVTRYRGTRETGQAEQDAAQRARRKREVDRVTALVDQLEREGWITTTELMEPPLSQRSILLAAPAKAIQREQVRALEREEELAAESEGEPPDDQETLFQPRAYTATGGPMAPTAGLYTEALSGQFSHGWGVYFADDSLAARAIQAALAGGAPAPRTFYQGELIDPAPMTPAQAIEQWSRLTEELVTGFSSARGRQMLAELERSMPEILRSFALSEVTKEIPPGATELEIRAAIERLAAEYDELASDASEIAERWRERTETMREAEERDAFAEGELDREVSLARAQGEAMIHGQTADVLRELDAGAFVQEAAPQLPGGVYAAELPAGDVLLQFDAPLARQSAFAKAAILGAFGGVDPLAHRPRSRGRDYYYELVRREAAREGIPTRSIDAQRLASLALRAQGIVGHEYLVPGAEGRRFVVYDEADVRPMERLYQPTRPEPALIEALAEVVGEARAADALTAALPARTPEQAAARALAWLVHERAQDPETGEPGDANALAAAYELTPEAEEEAIAHVFRSEWDRFLDARRLAGGPEAPPGALEQAPGAPERGAEAGRPRGARPRAGGEPAEAVRGDRAGAPAPLPAEGEAPGDREGVEILYQPPREDGPRQVLIADVPPELQEFIRRNFVELAQPNVAPSLTTVRHPERPGWMAVEIQAQHMTRFVERMQALFGRPEGDPLDWLYPFTRSFRPVAEAAAAAPPVPNAPQPTAAEQRTRFLNRHARVIQTDEHIAEIIRGAEELEEREAEAPPEAGVARIRRRTLLEELTDDAIAQRALRQVFQGPERRAVPREPAPPARRTPIPGTQDAHEALAALRQRIAAFEASIDGLTRGREATREQIAGGRDLTARLARIEAYLAREEENLADLRALETQLSGMLGEAAEPPLTAEGAQEGPAPGPGMPATTAALGALGRAVRGLAQSVRGLGRVQEAQAIADQGGGIRPRSRGITFPEDASIVVGWGGATYEAPPLTPVHAWRRGDSYVIRLPAYRQGQTRQWDAIEYGSPERALHAIHELQMGARQHLRQPSGIAVATLRGPTSRLMLASHQATLRDSGVPSLLVQGVAEEIQYVVSVAADELDALSRVLAAVGLESEAGNELMVRLRQSARSAQAYDPVGEASMEDLAEEGFNVGEAEPDELGDQLDALQDEVHREAVRRGLTPAEPVDELFEQQRTEARIRMHRILLAERERWERGPDSPEADAAIQRIDRELAAYGMVGPVETPAVQPPARRFVLRHEAGDYWSNEDGWQDPQDQEAATVFTEEEVASFENVPEGGYWELVTPGRRAPSPPAAPYDFDTGPQVDPNWRPEDAARAQAEGWDVFDSDERGLEIQRDDEAGIFETDEAAREHVARRSDEGSSLHRRALAVVGDLAERALAATSGAPVVGMDELPPITPADVIASLEAAAAQQDAEAARLELVRAEALGEGQMDRATWFGRTAEQARQQALALRRRAADLRRPESRTAQLHREQQEFHAGPSDVGLPPRQVVERPPPVPAHQMTAAQVEAERRRILGPARRVFYHGEQVQEAPPNTRQALGLLEEIQRYRRARNPEAVARAEDAYAKLVSDLALHLVGVELRAGKTIREALVDAAEKAATGASMSTHDALHALYQEAEAEITTLLPSDFRVIGPEGERLFQPRRPPPPAELGPPPPRAGPDDVDRPPDYRERIGREWITVDVTSGILARGQDALSRDKLARIKAAVPSWAPHPNAAGPRAAGAYVIRREELGQLLEVIDELDVAHLFDMHVLLQEATLGTSDYRGSITFSPDMRETVIRLTQAADLSTLLHELGHFYTLTLIHDSLQESAPDQLRRDAETLLRYSAGIDIAALGADPSLFTVEAKEKLANAFLAYLHTGRAPSRALEGAFARMREWLSAFWREIRASIGAENIPDDVRGVFDRLLATDAEIDAQREREEVVGSIFQAEELTPEEMDGLGASLAGVRNEATRELDRAQLLAMAHGRGIFAKIQAERARIQAQEKEALLEAVKAEMNALPVWQADHVLRTGTWPEPPFGTGNPVATPFKLSRTIMLEMFGRDSDAGQALLAVPTGARSWLYAEGGVHPDAVAEIWGFETGADLVRALLSADSREVGSFDRIAEAEARRRFREEGELAPGELEAMALRALAGERRVEFLLAEDRLLATRTGERAASREIIEATAQRIIGEKSAANLRPDHHAATRQKARRKALEAVQAGDYRTAAAELRRELLHTFLERYSREAREEAAKIVQKARRYARDPKLRERIGQAGGDHVSQIDGILETVEIRIVSAREMARRRLTLVEWVMAQEAAGNEVVLPDWAREATRRHWRTLTMTELRGLEALLDSIGEAARRDREIRVEGQTLRRDEVRKALVEEAKRGVIRPATRSSRLTPGEADWTKLWRALGRFDLKGAGLALGDRVFSAWRRVDALLVGKEGLVHSITQADPTSMWATAIIRPFAEAEVEHQDRFKSLIVPARELIEGFLDRYGRAKYQAILAETRLWNRWTKQPMELTLRDLIGIALNIGNQGNLDKLLGGYGWEEETVRRVLNDHLAAEDWKLVQDLWDLVDSLREQEFSFHEKMTGARPEMVEAIPFETPFGELRGGYFPVVYDPTRSEAQAMREAAEVLRTRPEGFGRVETRHPFTKRRTGLRTRALKIDGFSVVVDHLEDVSLDLAYREKLVDVHKLFQNEEFQDELRAIFGHEFGVQQFWLPWLQAMAGDSSTPRGLGSLERAAQWLHVRASAYVLLGRITTLAIQPTGLLNAWNQVTESVRGKTVGRGVRSTVAARYLANGLWQSLGRGDFAEMVRLRQQLLKESGVLRHRIEAYDRDSRELFRRLEGRSGWTADMTLAAAKFLAWVQLHSVDVPTYVAMRNLGRDQGLSERDAIAGAETAVKLSQGTASLTAQAKILAEAPWFVRPFILFYSYASGQFNQVRGSWRAHHSVPVTVAATMKAMIAPAIFAFGIRQLIYAVQNSLLPGTAPEPPDDDEWDERIAIEALGGLAGTIPFVRDTWRTFAFGEKQELPGSFGIWTDMLEDAGDAYAFGERRGEWDRLFWATLRALALAKGLPLDFLLETGSKVSRAESGRFKPSRGTSSRGEARRGE